MQIHYNFVTQVDTLRRLYQPERNPLGTPVQHGMVKHLRVEVRHADQRCHRARVAASGDQPADDRRLDTGVRRQDGPVTAAGNPNAGDPQLLRAAVCDSGNAPGVDFGRE